MIKLPRPQKVLLDSGATLLYQRNPVSPTVAFGVWISSGSRDEKEADRGYSHLLEHMVFRGTGKRSALDIALELEAIGGQWDAFTSKEATCYHGRVLEEHFDSFTDILSDIVLSPSLPADALELERKVVQEEIRSVKDSPEESTFELFFKNLFGNDPLGYPVAGRAKDISGCTRRKLMAFHRKTYTPDKTILGFIGNIPLKKVINILEKRFIFSGKAGRSSQAVIPGRSLIRRVSVKRSDWAQSHLCAGVRTTTASDPDRYPLIVLSNILGGGVSSRMFQNLREKAGLAYSIFSSSSFWKDAGAFMTYFSVEPRNLGRSLEIFHNTMEEIRRDGVTAEELAGSVAQLKASVVFGIENVDTRLFRLFHSEFYHRRYRSLSVLMRDIERVGLKDVLRVADLYLGEEKHLYVTCGPRPLSRLVPAVTRPARGR